MTKLQATQSDSSAPATIDSDGLAAGERLSLDEMTRIMDVAATLRKEQTLVEQQLNIDQIKATLRERLLEAAKVSGDPVTPAEIDAAVEQYYDRLHEFRDAPASFAKFLAHCWVLRTYLVGACVALAAAGALIWTLLAAGILPGEVHERQMAEQRLASIAEQLTAAERTAAAIKRISVEPAATDEADRLVRLAAAAREQGDANKLAAAANELQALLGQLELQYGLYIVNAPGEQSATERLWTDDNGTRTSGFFVFVDALDEHNRPVKSPIRNRETDRIESVSRWGELVPEEVFNRLADDKKSDGVLDERTFGRKPRGTREVQVELSGSDGQPIERRGQITSWK